MKQFALICLLLIACNNLFAQIIDNSEGISLIEENRFNQHFIKTNKIAVIRGEFSSKKEMDIIRPGNETVEYHFDRAGRLYKIDYLRIIAGEKDLVSTVFRFNADGTLIDKILADISGATSYRYEYNDKKQVISETCSRMESVKDTINSTGPKRTEVYKESIRYTDLDNGLKKVTYNSYNVPYKEEFTYYNENGYCVEKNTRFITNNRQSKILFSYNERGLLSEKILVDDIARADSLKFIYRYDSANNLLSAEEIQKGKLVRNIEFLYDSASWILNARLAKDEETTFIRIARYSTEFFNE